MKKPKQTLKITLILFVVTLIGCNSMKKKKNEKDSIVGTWIIEKSTFNGQGSPVPKGTSLKFTSDNHVKVTLPNFGENYEDISGLGSWKKVQNIITIEYDEKKLWAKYRSGRLTN